MFQADLGGTLVIMLGVFSVCEDLLYRALYAHGVIVHYVGDGACMVGGAQFHPVQTRRHIEATVKYLLEGVPAQGNVVFLLGMSGSGRTIGSLPHRYSHINHMIVADQCIFDFQLLAMLRRLVPVRRRTLFLIHVDEGNARLNLPEMSVDGHHFAAAPAFDGYVSSALPCNYRILFKDPSFSILGHLHLAQCHKSGVDICGVFRAYIKVDTGSSGYHPMISRGSWCA